MFLGSRSGRRASGDGAPVNAAEVQRPCSLWDAPLRASNPGLAGDQERSGGAGIDHCMNLLQLLEDDIMVSWYHGLLERGMCECRLQRPLK